MKHADVIHCIGDSHASFFSGQNGMQPRWPEKASNVIPFLNSYRLGAVLAYNLCQEGSSSHGREKLFNLLREIPKGSYVLMSFGEIDCRAHLIKQAQKQNRLITEVVPECVKRYFDVLLEIKKDFNVIAWAVIPSTSLENIIDPRYPHVGSNHERNDVTKIFNDNLKMLAQKNAIPFISIFHQLIYPDGSTNNKFFIDKIHLSQRAMPLFIKQLEKDLPAFHKKLYINKIILKLPDNLQYQLITLQSTTKTLFFQLSNNLKKVIRNTTKKSILAIFGPQILQNVKIILRKLK